MNPRPSAFPGRLAVLDISHVRDLLLRSASGDTVRLDIGIPVFIRREGDALELTVPLLDPDICLDFPLSDNRFWHTCSVQIVSRELRFGKRPYFSCPFSGGDCLKLFISGHVIASQSSFKEASSIPFSNQKLRYVETRRKLLKLDGSQRLSSGAKLRIAREIAKRPELYKSDPELQGVFADLEKIERRRRAVFDWESRAISTTKALDEGRGINQYDLFHWYEGTSEDWLENVPGAPYERPETADRTHRYPELDIKILLQRGAIEHGELRGRTLGWPLEATDGCIIYLFVDGRFSELPYLVFARQEPSSPSRSWQKVALLPGPNSSKARYFLCPVTKARCETLYFRDGSFASPQAQRLRKDNAWSAVSLVLE